MRRQTERDAKDVGAHAQAFWFGMQTTFVIGFSSEEDARRGLARRSQHGMDWERFNRMLKVFILPAPAVIHSTQRHVAKP